MKMIMDEYFKYCDNRTASKVDDDGRTVTYPNPEAYTMAGLAYWLGFEDRNGLLEYEKRPEFSSIVKRARTKIQSWWESRLGDKSPTGAIFWLKNHAGYRDEQHMQHGGNLTITWDKKFKKAL